MNYDVKNIIDTIDSRQTDDHYQVYEALAENSMVIDAKCAIENGDTEAFYVALNYPINKFMDGFIETNSSNKYEIFLYRHSKFIESNFGNAIKQVEGPICVNEKTKTIMNGLATYFKNNIEIIFDRNQPYTYHLPTIIFITHNDIYEHFVSLFELYHGSPERYLSFFDKNAYNLRHNN